MKTKRFLAVLLTVVMLIGMMPTSVFAYDPEDCPHTNAYFTEGTGEPSCFEPAMGGYWYCEDCWMYYDADMRNMYWDENEMFSALKKPATGHAFNSDTGKCDNCGIPNPVYSKITSLSDVNEEDMYIIVANVGDRYFVLGGLNVNELDPMGNAWCYESGNAVEVVPYADGSISLLNQNYVGNARPSEFMFDIDPDQFNSDLDENFGLTPMILKLDNYCVYPFQSYSLDNTGYMGVARYGNGVYGMWDTSEWIIDFYTTVVDENTYRDDMDGYTHAEQVARGNIGENISEGDLLLYKASFYAVGGAMFILRFREYPNPDTGVTEYYFICGEDWALEGSPGWDYVTDTTPTNDTQYAISLYRYDVPGAPTHTCDFGDWVDDQVTETHTRTCKDPECGKTETEPHDWDDGVQNGTPTCTEGAEIVYTCTGCGKTKTEDVDNLGHDWSKWTYDSVDSHTRYCKRECGIEQEIGGHEWGDWLPVDGTTHTMGCDICNGEQTGDHDWDNGVVTKEPTEWEEGVKTYTCGTCSHTKTEPVDKLEHVHSWSDWGENDETTHIRSCRCNETQTAGHNFDDGVVINWATHLAPGEIHYTCSDCGYVKIGTQPKLEDHEWDEWVINKLDEANTHIRFCICNESQTAPHNFDNGVVTEPATHTSKGVKTFTCTDGCGYSYTEDIPVLTDHAWGEWVINKLDEANTHIRFCICNESQTAPHNFDDGVVTEPATHTSKGVKTFTCTDGCGYSYTEDIPTTPEHTWTSWSPNGDGTHTRSCRCNANETKDCTYDAGVVTTEPTHYEEGVKTFTCTVCGGQKTEPVAKTTAHEWSDWAEKDDKSHIRECKCGEVETKDHSFDAGVVTKEPTHLEAGVKKFTCGECGFVREETLDKTTEHTLSEWKTEATVVGKHYRECACGEREIGECTWNEGIVTAEPTYEATGTKTYTCTVCGGTKTETLDMLVKAEEIVSPDNSGIKITAPEGSNAVLNENTVLKVEEVKNEVPEDVKANVAIVVGDDNAEVLAAYDISLILDGATVQPGGKVEVTLPAPENAADFDALQVVYIDDEGNVTPCETRVNADGTVTFVTDHFSHYAIIGIPATSPLVWILISSVSVALIAAAVVGLLVIKKKKGIA